MAGRLDASRVIRPFNGEGDISAWLAKVELVASLTDVKDVAKFLPLYLEGGALALYLELILKVNTISIPTYHLHIGVFISTPNFDVHEDCKS